MNRLLVLGELLIAMITVLAGVLSWMLLVQLPTVVPAMILGLVALVRPSIVLNHQWSRWTLHLASAANTCWCLFFAVSVIASHSQSERYVVPTGYQGWVYIIFDKPLGRPHEYDGSRRVYRIPENGVLLTQFSSNAGWSVTPVEYLEESGVSVSARSPAMGSWMNANGQCSGTYAKVWIGPGTPTYYPDHDGKDAFEAACRTP